MQYLGVPYIYICWQHSVVLVVSEALEPKISKKHVSTLCMLGNFSWIFLSNLAFSKKKKRVSNRLDPDQAQHSVGPDLGPICLQILSAEDKLPLARKEFNSGNI